jgi:hypothetical protein
MPESMPTLTAYAMGEAHRNKEARVFDWDKAAEIIVDRRPSVASAGLSEDWGCTASDIYMGGAPKDDSRPYLASTWATPVLILDDDSEIECWRYATDTPGWDCNTYWPDSAREILNAATGE